MNTSRHGECQTCSTLRLRLEVFSHAIEGDRVNTHTWELQPNTWATSFYRRWQGLSRVDTVRSFDQLFADCRLYVHDSMRNVWNRRLLLFHIKEAIPGMGVIRDTYQHTSTYDELDAIIKQFGELAGSDAT